MNTAPFKRYSDWIPVAIVLGVVLVAGSRLITLSLQQHAAQARESAQVIVGRYGLPMESQLRTLVTLAQRESARAARTFGNSSASGQLSSAVPARHTFWLANDGTTLLPVDSDAATVQSIASEWQSADAQGGAAAPGLLGPIRHRSQWIVAARAPIDRPTANGAVQRAGWGIAYRPLHQVLTSAKLGELSKAGYDYELSQLDPLNRRSRIFFGSRNTPLTEPVTRPIHLPVGLLRSVPGDYLTLAIRPRAGWYPKSEIAAQIALLAVIAWLLAVGTRDLTRKTKHLQAALATSKERMRAVNQQLMTEIEARQNLQKSFDHARYHDAFTGLPNRRYFMDQLDRALRQLRSQRGQRIAVVLVDIDRFKFINDILGHTAGDEVMVQVARRFERAASALECVLARWGGDQFALLLFDVHSSDTAIAIARLLQDALREPFGLRKHRLTVAARMGVTSVDSGLQRAEDVLRQADIALSVAKTHESARAIAYDPAMVGDMVSLVSLEADLHIALERDQFQLLFQPIVNLRSQRVVGAEALLRWQHPLEGLLTPDRFLVIAEEAGVTLAVTRWVILKACRAVNQWRHRWPQGEEPYVSVNLSASSLRDPGLVEYVAEALRETHTPAASLRFEITESCLISNVGAAHETLGRLHAMGVQLMFDDFGTGYSSLSYLQLFPFSCVKIDRPFVSRSGQSRADSGVTGAMVQMASSLGLKTIAEKVETQAAVDALQQMGFDFGQGRFFGEPADAEQVLNRIRGLHSDDSATLPQPAPAITADSTSKRSPTLVQPAVMAKADAPIDDAATLVDTMVIAKPIEPSDGTDTLVETAIIAPADRPIDDADTLVETQVLTTPIEPSDDSPTVVEPTTTSAPKDDSDALGKTQKLATTIELEDNSPTLVLRRRQPSRAG